MKLKDRIKNALTLDQMIKLLETVFICLALLLVVEIICDIPVVSDYFSSGALTNKSGIWVWVTLWLVMFGQVTIIPIPAFPLLVFCNNTSLVASGNGLMDLFSKETMFFVAFVVSATLAGSICSYWLGRLFGKKAIKWVAGSEEEYDKWCSKLNGKVGSWLYALTILLPIFPDDLLTIVAGAVRIKFWFFCVAHLICKLIGTFCIFLFIRLPFTAFFFSNQGQGFPIALVVYALLTITSLILIIVLKKKQKKLKQV